MKEENLIFIISQPRSGSTYLQNLLSNNKETNTTSETWLLLNYANQIKPKLIQASFDNKMATRAFKDYKDKNSTIDFNDKQKKFILSLYDPLMQGYRLVIDKTPRYWEILDELVLLFPKSKIIILKRHPLNVAKSIIKTWALSTIKQLSYYKRDLLFAPQKLHNFSCAQKSNPNVYTLKYEDLVSDTFLETEKIYNWLGIKYEENVVDTSKNKKYKGSFGDPYQNPEFNNLKTINNNVDKLTARHKNFLSGYASYLGQMFLLEYGNYDVEDVKPRKTVAFSQFVHFGMDKGKYSIKKEVRYLVKEIIFRMIK